MCSFDAAVTIYSYLILGIYGFLLFQVLFIFHFYHIKQFTSGSGGEGRMYIVYMMIALCYDIHIQSQGWKR